MDYSLGLFGSHNSALAIAINDEVKEVVELERWTGIKNAAFAYHFPIDKPQLVLQEILNYFKNKYGVETYTKVAYTSDNDLHKNVKALGYQYVPHHTAHCANGLYQSDYNRALVISFDGGSEEGFFKIFEAEKGKDPKLLTNVGVDLCVPYAAVAHYLAPIKKEENWWKGNLVYAGKIMGLAGYGKVVDSIVPSFYSYYLGQSRDNVNIAHERYKKLNILEKPENIAATSQYVFEQIFSNIISGYKSYLPIIFCGGGAMNILNNTKHEAFVSPNPDDRGLALGCLLHILKPTKKINSMYLGMPWNEDGYNYISPKQFADKLIDEKILGLVQGRSEHGARALGNRSIICLPKNGMKDKLNNTIKFRESFRPFSPMCKEEDKHKWFKSGNFTKWMSHNAEVIDNKNKNIESIIHKDNTARLQTITEQSNNYLYNVLTELETEGVEPVLLNTSFNIQGKPILNTFKDAKWMLDNTGLDDLIIIK
jgi:carbamoyltransferase